MQVDRFAHISKSFVAGLTLANTPRKTGNLRNNETIFARIE